MIIKKACATFGCLDDKTIEFNGGLNILCMENESGKSTWCAFILAMLYGIDTRDRGKAPTKDNPFGRLPDKTKYQPWNGKPMSGRLVIELDGREIEITRSNLRGAAFQSFSAVYTDTLEPVPGLTAANCGQTLCGVCREVFEKSAFIQSGTVVCAGESAELENRINSLATSGDDSGAASAFAQRLNKFKNQLRSNSANGAIPRQTEKLTQAESKISDLRRLSEEEVCLRTQINQASAQLDDVCKKLETLHSYELWDASQSVCDAKSAAENARARLDQARKSAVANDRALTSDFINEAQRRLTLANSAEKALYDLKERRAPEEKTFIELREQLSALRPSLPALKKFSPLPIICAALFALLAIILKIYAPSLFVASSAVALLWIIFCIGYAVFISRKNKNAKAEFDIKKHEFDLKSAEFSQAEKQNEQLQSELAQARSDAADKIFSLVEYLCPFRPGISDVRQAEDFINECRAKVDALCRAEYEFHAADEKYNSLASVLGDFDDVKKPSEQKPEQSAELLSSQKERLTELINSLERRCAALKGEMSSIGDIASLSAFAGQSEALIALMKKRYDAIELAEQVLSQVSAQLSAKISAPLSRLAEKYLHALTDGKYGRFELGDRFTAACAMSESDGCVSADRLSSGTSDALYLAFRLAVCSLVLSEQNPPIILDDALLALDDARTDAALKLLSELAESRQIILFCCKPLNR